MDTRTAEQARVEAGLTEIRDYMPKTYAAIKARAAEQGASAAYGLVRRSLRGEANCFYAMEAGRCVGTPFDADLTVDAAMLMVRWGCSFMVAWALPGLAASSPSAAVSEGAGHGAH